MTTKAEVLTAIRFQCEECMGSMLARKREFSQEARNLVVGCTAPECSLFAFRLGKVPWPKRKVTAEGLKNLIPGRHSVARKRNFNDRRLMHTIALLPARGGSKRIPGKNIKLLGGKPLVEWSIETALALELPCYVSTDSRVIADISRQAGAQVIHRPAELASDTATDWDVIRHALGQVEADLLVYLRPTTPMRDPQVVWNAIRLMQLNQDVSLLRSTT